MVHLTVPHKESFMTLLYFTGYLKNSTLTVFRGSSYFTSEEHALLIDVLVVTSSIKDPVIALAMLLAIFFILNREIQLTLKFFQRCLVGINLVSGTKYAKQGT